MSDIYAHLVAASIVAEGGGVCVRDKEREKERYRKERERARGERGRERGGEREEG